MEKRWCSWFTQNFALGMDYDEDVCGSKVFPVEQQKRSVFYEGAFCVST